jgi:maltooligosyltrehalose trehalohydrolase
MLFQGQEFAASSPFYYFADHKIDLAKLVHEGRTRFLMQFPSVALPEMRARVRDPADPETFRLCKLDLTERQKHNQAYTLTRDLLRLRREDPVFRAPRRGGVEGAVLGPEAFLLRFFSLEHGDRLLLVNLGCTLPLLRVPEPLLAPPAGQCWEVLWSSEDPRYGGHGAPPPVSEEGWQLFGHAAVVLRPA